MEDNIIMLIKRISLIILSCILVFGFSGCKISDNKYNEETFRVGENGAYTVPLQILPEGVNDATFLNEVGIPLPCDSQLNNFSLTTDDGDSVPLQYRVAARHPDGSPSWLHIAFISRPGTERYHLHCSRESVLKNPIQNKQKLKIRETTEEIVIETGKAVFILDRKKFLPFRKIQSGNKIILETKTNYGLILQKEYVSSQATVKIEERGPVKAQVLYSGQLADKAGSKSCSFSARLYFAAGSTSVRIDITLFQDTEEVFLDLKELSFRIPVNNAKSVRFYPNDKKVTGKILPTTYIQEGKKLLNHHWNYPWSVTSDNIKTAEGQRGKGLGMVRLTDGSGIEFAIQDFWENGPKSIEVDKDNIKFNLYPDTGIMLPVHVGMAKTHRLFLNFLPDCPGESTSEANAFLSNARAFPGPKWYSHCSAPVSMIPRRKNQFSGFERLVDQWLERRFIFQREIYGEYGWLDFGDFRQSMYENYWNNNETLLDHGLFVQFARTGDKKYFDWGEQTLRHYQDIDLRHHTPKEFDYGIMMGPDLDRQTAQKWGKKTSQERQKKFIYFGASTTKYAPFVHGFYHFGRKVYGQRNGKYYCGGSMNEGHCFMLGLITYYYMTGDRHSLEMARRVGETLMKKFRYQTINRATAMPALFLMELSVATGDKKYLDQSGKAINFWINHPNKEPDYLYVVTRALARYVELTGDEKAKRLFFQKINRQLNQRYTADDGVHKGILAPVQAHADPRYYTQLADLADAFAFNDRDEYITRGITTFECLVENHVFDSVALSSVPAYLKACEKLNCKRIAETLPEGFILRFPDEKVFFFQKEDNKSLTVRLYTDSGFRTSKDAIIKGQIKLYSPDGVVRKWAVDKFGFYTYTITIPAVMPAGDYKVVAKGTYVVKGKNRQILWNAWSDNGKVVVKVVPGFLSLNQTSMYFQVPLGTRSFSIEIRPMLNSTVFTTAYELYGPEGNLRKWAVYPGNGNTQRIIKIDSVPENGHGLWRLRIPFGKNYLNFKGIPPFFALRKDSYFHPQEEIKLK